MALLAPNIVGPVSPCNSALLLQGLVPGAEVIIFALTIESPSPGVEREISRAEVARGMAIDVEQTFHLVMRLRPNQKLIAVQRLRTELGLESARGEHVSAAPMRGRLSELTWVSRLIEGGRCIWLQGAFPGAIVAVKDSGGTVLAQEQTLGSIVRMGLNRRIRSGEVLTATQTACDVSGPDTRSPGMPLSGNTPLPPPRIVGPLYQCDRLVPVVSVLPGATVRLERSSGRPGFEGCFDASELNIPLPITAALTNPEQLIARQGFPDLSRWSGPSAPEPVRPAAELPTPEIVPPLCPGVNQVVVKNLRYGAQVTIFVTEGGRTRAIGRRTAAGQTDIFDITPVNSGAISVRAEFCGVRRESRRVTIASGPTRADIRVVMPSACSSVIQIQNVRPGDRVAIISSLRGYISEATATSEEVSLIAPGFLENESLTVLIQSACLSSPIVRRNIIPLPFSPIVPPAPPMVLSYALACDNEIGIAQTTPGAVIEVWEQDRGGVESLRGATVSSSDTMRVPLAGRLNAGNKIIIRQRLCSRESRSIGEEEVRLCRGRIRIGPKLAIDRVSDREMPVLTGRANSQLNWMRKLYRFHGFDVEILDTESLPLGSVPATIISTDPRTYANLLRNRRGLRETDIAVYFVKGIIGAAGFSVGNPNWTIVDAFNSDAAFFFHHAAHEVGHCLGLGHTGCGRNDMERRVLEKRLMYGAPAGDCDSAPRPGNDIGGAAEALISTEVDSITRSRYVVR